MERFEEVFKAAIQSMHVVNVKAYGSLMANVMLPGLEALKPVFKATYDQGVKDEQEKLEGCVVVPEAEFALLPKTITPEIEEILGMPCFKFIKAAQIYRQLGFNIPPKAEKEQSFFMFKFLHLALVHGDKCFDVFESETKAMVEAARGGNE
ncbi:hypothetical protein PY247_12790 [Acinetobacter proteolyticus]|nr:hypothetical protein [Acinetobacter proteolyticus]WEI17367.1 hypothetical protein PY247_12790 [Acinetobacter proteolyticus]